MKRTIVAIVGESGAGKTHASLYMQANHGFTAIVSYTTRLRREGEIQGRDHHFTRKKYMPPQEKMCAYTFFGGNHYWTLWTQIYESLFTSVYVIDEKGLIDLQSKEAPIPLDIIKVKIKRNNLDDIDQKRKKRDQERISLPDSTFDYIIENNGSLSDFERKLDHLCNEINNKVYGSTNN